MDLRNIILYISGPYSGKNDDEIKENINIAKEYAQQFWNGGFSVICPHTNTALFSNDTSYHDYLLGDLFILARTDGIVMIDGWELSPGAITERNTAKTLGLPIFDISKDSVAKIQDYYTKKIKGSSYEKISGEQPS